MEIYAKRYSLFQHKYKEIRKKYKLVGALRLVAFLAIVYCFYLSVSRADYHYLYVTGGLIVVFLVLLRIHASYSWKMRYVQALMQINQEEDSFVKEDLWPFDNGSEFHTPDHPYAFDLDIVGPKSIYQYLNRTASYKGKEYLAELLKSRRSKEDILKNQEVIKELSQKVEWRQEIYAYSKLSNLNKEAYDRLKAWSESNVNTLSKLSLVLAYVLPLIFLVAAIATFVDSKNIVWGYIASTVFSLNLICAFSKVRAIQVELGGVEKIHETIASYSSIIKRIEREDFATERMKEYLTKIKGDSFKASAELQKLSRLFEQLETVANLFVSILFNGLFQFHVHVLHKFLTWKKEKDELVLAVIDIVGEVEAFNSWGIIPITTEITPFLY